MTKGTSEGTPHYMWENDPHSVPMTPERREVIDDMVWRIYRGNNEVPTDPEDAKAYAEWLKSNKD